jgi:hypothetical protein
MGNCNRHESEFSSKALEISYLNKPFCYIGTVESDQGNIGTGILIHNSCVLTCSRVLLESKSGQKINLEKLKFTPGRSGNVKPFGSIDIIDYYIHIEGVTGEIGSWCLLYLANPVGFLINQRHYSNYFNSLCVRIV